MASFVHRDGPLKGPRKKPEGSPQPSGLVGPVTPQIYGTQEALDLSISGWTISPTLLAQGAVPAFIFAAAQFFDQSSAAIYKPQAAPTVVVRSVPAFLATQQQSYQDVQPVVFASELAGARPSQSTQVSGYPVDTSQLAAQIFPSVRAGNTPTVPQQVYANTVDPTQTQAQVWKPAATPPAVSGFLGTRIVAAPEVFDLGISGWTIGATLLNQGPVPALTTVGAQPDTTQYSKIWQSVRTPPAAASGAVPPFTRIVQELPIQPAPLVWGSASSIQGPGIGSEYINGTHAFAIYNAETLKSKIWPSARAPAITTGILGTYVSTVPQPDLTQKSSIWASQVAGQTTPVLKTIIVPPQADPTQIAPLFIESATTPPIILGATLYQTLFAAPQYIDLTQQATFQAAIQNGVVPPPVTTDQSTGGRTIRHDWWKSKDQVEKEVKDESRKRRERIQEAVDSQKPNEKQQTYLEEGRKAVDALRQTKDAIADVEAEIAEINDRLTEEGIKRTRAELAAVEQEMLIARQAAQLLAIQEAVLIEELEVIDIAYVALAALLLNS